MSKLSEELRLDLPLESASLVCRNAVAGIGWNLKSVEPHRIVAKVGVGISRNPSNIEVLLTPVADGKTVVVLSGSIMGVGPLQKRHLTGEMNRLRNAIEVAAAQPRNPAPTGDAESPSTDEPMEQLRKLGELRDAGVLTAAEFEAKKHQLLDRI